LGRLIVLGCYNCASSLLLQTVDAGVDQQDGWIVPVPNASSLANAASVVVAEVRRRMRDRRGGIDLIISERDSPRDAPCERAH
jgi:hypothetical protein